MTRLLYQVPEVPDVLVPVPHWATTGERVVSVLSLPSRGRNIPKSRISLGAGSTNERPRLRADNVSAGQRGYPGPIPGSEPKDRRQPRKYTAAKQEAQSANW
jgi:hypothetical protein